MSFNSVHLRKQSILIYMIHLSHSLAFHVLYLMNLFNGLTSEAADDEKRDGFIIHEYGWVCFDCNSGWALMTIWSGSCGVMAHAILESRLRKKDLIEDDCSETESHQFN